MHVFYLGTLLLVSAALSVCNEVKRQSFIPFPRVGRSVYESDFLRPDSLYLGPEHSIQSQILEGVRQYKRQGLIPYPRVGKRQSFIPFPRVGKRQNMDGSDPANAFFDMTENESAQAFYDGLEPTDELFRVEPRGGVGKFPFGPRLGREKRQSMGSEDKYEKVPQTKDGNDLVRFPFNPRLGNSDN